MQLLFSFQGRINRLQFFMRYCLLVGLVIALAVGAAVFGRSSTPVTGALLALVVGLGVIALVLWGWYSLTWRRMADMGVPKRLRRPLLIAWSVLTPVMAAMLGHALAARLILSLVPFLAMVAWPGQTDGEDAPAPTVYLPDPPPSPVPVPMRTAPVRKPAPAPAPAPYRPAPAFAPPPLGADGRPVFGRRNLSPAPR